jgi:hypothetical protein
MVCNKNTTRLANHVRADPHKIHPLFTFFYSTYQTHPAREFLKLAYFISITFNIFTFSCNISNYCSTMEFY